MRAMIRILAALGLLAPFSPAHAQSTDGFHEIQVFPVVVDSTSFSQRFDFRAISSGTGAAELHPRYFPAQGTSQAGPIDCPIFTVNYAGAGFDSLRALCPALGAGPQFGFLVIEQRSSEHLAFSGFSRVSNPAGAGFSVEAFPAHTFTSALVTASGLRRKSATAGSPAFQSNCFVGLMGEHTPNSSTTRLLVGLVDANGNDLGQPTVLDLLPGQMVRMLDVFNAAGAPAGDHDRATFLVRQVFEPIDAPRPGVIAFCTVQDNTSFGADFRIAKQEYGTNPYTPGMMPGGYDGHVFRVTHTNGNSVGPGFSLSTATQQQNTHIVYFRNPDWASCELVDRSTYERLGTDGGLEMRMLAWDAHGYTPMAGGAGIVGFDRIYLGDKRERAEGFNTQYIIQVENTQVAAEPGLATTIEYGLRCWSGSGHTRGDMIVYRREASDF